MERIVQYLDELEDLICAFLTIGERIRRALQMLLLVAASMIFQALGIVLALARPPLALAAVALMIVGMLYRSVVAPSARKLVTS